MKTFHASITAILFCFFALISQPLQAEMAACQNSAKLDNCPSASFYIVNNSQLTGTPIRFANTSTTGQSYLWDFGDGNTSTAENPTHVYGAPGTYSVKLIVIGDSCTVEFIGTEDVIIG